MKKSAYWIKHTHVLRSDEFVCSNCGDTESKAKRICPGCGCTMKGTKSDLGWIDEMEAMDAFFDD